MAAVSPQTAGHAVTGETADLDLLKEDLLVLEEISQLEEPIVDFLRASLHGNTRRTRGIAQKKLAPAIAKTPSGEWSRAIEQTTRKINLFSSKEAISAGVQATLSSNGLEQKLRTWRWEAQKINAMRLGETGRDERLEELLHDWVKMVRKANNLAELVKILETGLRARPFGLSWDFSTGVRPALRRAILKYWEPGVILPLDTYFVELNKLFEIDSFNYGLDDEDRTWINKNIGGIKNPSYDSKKEIERAWAIVRSDTHSLNERVLAAMVLQRLHYGGGHAFSHRPKAGQFKNYIEGRAKEGQLDLVDLMLVSSFAYHENFYLSLNHYSPPTQETLLETALDLSPWSKDWGWKATPFPMFDSEGGLMSLPHDLQFQFAKAVFKKGIALRSPNMNAMIPSKFLQIFTHDELEELLSLYETDRETAILHAGTYLDLLSHLPQERRSKHHAHLASLIDPEFLPEHARQINQVLDHLANENGLKRLTSHEMDRLIGRLAAVAEKANDLYHQHHPDHSHHISIYQKALRTLMYELDPLRESEIPAPLAAAAYIESWLERPLINFAQLVNLILAVAPYQDDAWVARVMEKTIFPYSNPNIESRVYSSSLDPTKLTPLSSRVDPAELRRMLEPVVRTYFRNPFNGHASDIQKKLIEWGFADVPALESKEGFASLLKYSLLDEATREKIQNLIRMAPSPLGKNQRRIVMQSIVQANVDMAWASFLARITEATSLKGMVYEWILLSRDLQNLTEKDRRDFVREQNIRYAGFRNPASLPPPKIRRTLRAWLFDRFTGRIGFSRKEAGAFRQHFGRHAKAWHQNNFFAHLTTMAGFANEKGRAAIKALVMGIVKSPVEPGAGGFSWSFRSRGMKQLFGPSFLKNWQERRVYEIDYFQNDLAAADPAQAKRDFARRVAEQLSEHLHRYADHNGEVSTLMPEPAKTELADIIRDLAAIERSLHQGNFPERGRVESVAHAFDSRRSLLEGDYFIPFREIRNDLAELLRGWDRSFEKTKMGRVIISGDPRDIIRAGLIGQKACTRPNESGAGTRSAEPAGRALHGPLLVAIFEREGEEVARTLLEAVPEKDGPHITAWPLYAEGGFSERDMLERILLHDGAKLGVPEERIHIEFTGRNMNKKPTLLPSRFPSYPEGFGRSNEPALAASPHSF
ncbi:MAG: hypothetical protein HY609_01735 [Deltaproteobacteria bacterium]|nr:hypothetical protein [Deltaproteobacteria bacterium]MBI4223628.1 hypothetical protein [Deltaproteobacteria bacterium]